MLFRNGPRARIKRLAGRIDQARQAARDAQAEAQKSRNRHEQIMERVVEPLHKARDRNHFAAIIEASLHAGRKPHREGS